ncbi:AAA family ATPase [Kitasatospora sp. NPDC101155]|uniref:nSTAND1 domain-containing NTPase n=1 Tax=Kitasatospora sp. NPDC101155 TaxID=3364097 RepID=UPI00381F6D38
MTEAGEPPADREIRLHAQAADHARIYQAHRDLIVSERDLHLHYEDGVRTARRVESNARPIECPYPGLAAFSVEQARWFFGRDALTADLLVRLDERLYDGGALVVIAPSGAGKSSLLKAGLLPALARGALPPAGSAQWPRSLFTPTATPLTALAAELARVTDSTPQQVAEALADGPAAVVAMLSETLQGQAEREAGARRRWVVVVDQLEELFTLCPSERDRRAFLDLLGALAEPGRDGQDPVGLVVFGLRSDFYTPCADYPQLRVALENRPVVVGPMSETDLRQAVLFPARAVGLEIEPGLVDVLLRDLGAPAPPDTTNPPAAAAEPGISDAGKLPLLAHALRATWQQAHGHTLTVEGYRATGGIAHAVAGTADKLYARLDPTGQRAAHTIFLRLVKIGTGVEDTRRRLPYADLLNSGDDAAATVIERFTQGRLLTREGDHVEITHEVLLRAWPRLRDWIKADRTDNLTRQELEEAALTWHRAQREAGMLYRGGRLEAARIWNKAPREETLSPIASEFLAASHRQDRRAARIRTIVISTLTILALITSSAAVYAFRQRATAQAERNTAIFNQLTAEADTLRSTRPSVAAQLDLTAYHLKPAPDELTHLITDANNPLSTDLTGHVGYVWSVAFSPDRPLLATGGADRTVRLWDVTDPDHPTTLGQPLTGYTSNVYSVAFSPDRPLLATGSGDGTVRLWDVTHPAHPTTLGQPLTGHTGIVRQVAFSPDRPLLATASFDQTVRLWDVADPDHPTTLGQPLTGHAGRISSVAFSPDGHTLATGSYDDGTVQLWDVTHPDHPTALGQPLTGHTGRISSVAFSPDRHTLATGSDDQTVRLWDVTHPAHPTTLGQPLTGHTGSVESVAFSPDPDKHTLASGGLDGTVRLWNVADPDHPTALGQPLTGHTGTVASVAFSPDKHTLATGSADGTVRVWHRPATLLTGHTAYVESVAFSPDRHTLATGSADGTVRLWDTTDPAHPTTLGQPLTGHTGIVASVAFSPDKHTLASGGVDGTVRLWDVTDPAHPTTLGQPLTGHTNDVLSVAFSPDKHTLASGSADGTVRLWDVTDPAHPTTLGQLTAYSGYVNSVAFSPDPDKHTLATGSADGTVRLWDVTHPAHPTALGQPLTGHTSQVASVAFSPDGHTLASGGGDGTVRLWDVTDPAHPTAFGQPLTGHTSDVASVAFSPDKHTLASGGVDGTVRLWDVTDPAHPTTLGQPLTGHTGIVASVAFSPDPDKHTLASGSGDDTVRLWQMSADEASGQICASTDSISPRQWQQYLPQLPFKPPCK